MINKDFFPTPQEMTIRMLEGYKNLGDKRILEPSAGKGDMADVICLLSSHGYENRKNHIYCIEIESDLQEILRGKGYKVIDSDFLRYDGDTDFDLIVANFPFSNGEDHFLKAWDILRNGDIVCLLSAETIRNPFSEKRKLLAKILEDNGGTVEYIQDGFSAAERRTRVEVALVRISKTTKRQEHDFGDKWEREEYNVGQEFLNNSVQTRNLIHNVVQDYNTAKDLYSKGLAYIEQAKKISSSISDNYKLEPYQFPNKHHGSGDVMIRECLMEYTEQFKFGVWNWIIKGMGGDRFMTSKVREDFQNYMKQQGNIAITENNIETFMRNIMMNSGKIMDETVIEVFDDFTKYHKENRVYVEGWKSNSSWKISKKIVLPNRARNSYGPKYYADRVNDIDKVMCYLTGTPIESVKTIQDGIENGNPGEAFETEFFKCRFYKKGTLHATFKDEKLWQDFTMKAVHGKGWLPPEEKKRYEESNMSLVVR